jgi:alanine dehydrogenase
VVIDVSIDQGGCVETSRPTTLDDPVFLAEHVLHYCVPNMTADIARTASVALSQAILPYVLELAGSEDRSPRDCPSLARGIYTHAGEVAHPALGDRWKVASSSVREGISQ